MNVLLTDVLTCPRCGPTFGLILLAQDVKDRRVWTGEFGCPNCRDRFHVVDGFTDLRAPPRLPLVSQPDTQSTGADSGPEAMKVAAALGVPEGPGFFVFSGAVCSCAAEVAALVRGIEIITVGAPGGAPSPGVSPIAADVGFPVRGSARGVALDLEQWDKWGAEAARVVTPGGRVVVLGNPDEGLGPPSHPMLTLLLQDGVFGVFQRD
ncbi:MAG: hypothetical protein ACR2QM_01820 [Longimicrobiales bacterium]